MEFESRVHWYSAPPLFWVLGYTRFQYPGAGESVLEMGQAELLGQLMTHGGQQSWWVRKTPGQPCASYWDPSCSLVQ
jgi:hypothetical protein